MNTFGELGSRTPRHGKSAFRCWRWGPPVPAVARVSGLSMQTQASVTSTHRRSVASTHRSLSYFSREPRLAHLPRGTFACTLHRTLRDRWCNRHTRSGRKRGRETSGVDVPRPRWYRSNRAQNERFEPLSFARLSPGVSVRKE